MITREIEIKTKARNELVDITQQVAKVVKEAGVAEGICMVVVPHTTAGVTINENADPSVKADIIAKLGALVPAGDRDTSAPRPPSPAHDHAQAIPASQSSCHGRRPPTFSIITPRNPQKS